MDSDQAKIFVGGISWETSEEKLKDYFGNFGSVVETVIVKDRTTGRARGFGFVAFSDPATVDSVILEKHSIDGRMGSRPNFERGSKLSSLMVCWTVECGLSMPSVRNFCKEFPACQFN